MATEYDYATEFLDRLKHGQEATPRVDGEELEDLEDEEKKEKDGEEDDDEEKEKDDEDEEEVSTW